MADANLHLLRRATYGPTPASAARLAQLGRDGWLREQLAPARIADPVADAVLQRFPGHDWTSTRIRAGFERFSWEPMQRLVRATIARAIWSERQLFEVVVELFSNHLNVACPSGDVWDSRMDYDARVIRRHAFGRFADMLVAAGTHTAMLRYLDNASSTKKHPNENHGRELLELHTVGIGAGYTEADVRNSALILTGMTVDWTTGESVFNPAMHHVGPVRVMGFSHDNATAAGGRDVVTAYLTWLARHPATAHGIARKLAVRFVSDTPPAALVDRLAATYLREDTAIVPVLWELLRSSEFHAAEGQKLRRPYEDVVATARAVGVRPDVVGAKSPDGTKGVTALHWILTDMGHAPLGWNPPNGYPDVAAAWQSAAGTLHRWGFHMDLVAGWWPNQLATPKPATLLPARLPATHGELVDALCRRLIRQPSTSVQREAICAFLDVAPRTPLRPTSPAVGWRLPYVVALVLDSPQFGIR